MCTWKEYEFCCFLMNALSISMKSNWSNVSFKSTASCWFCCLDDLFIDVSGMLKSSTIFVVLSISSYKFTNFYLFWCSYIRFIYVNKHCIFLYWFIIMKWSFWAFVIDFVLKSILSDEYCYLSFLVISIGIRYFHHLTLNLYLQLWSESLVHSI